MNDEELERHLRNLPAPELPAAWRTEILGAAVQASEPRRPNGPTILLFLRNLFARNPYTATALTALWLLIFLFRATTPIDPTAQQMLAHLDSNRPVYLVDLATEIRLAELLQDESNQPPTPRIP